VPELAAAAFLVSVAVPFVGPVASTHQLRAEVAAHAARAIEQASPAEHHDHGHAVGAGDRVVCGVDVFGTDPRNPGGLGEVRAVYGYYFCAVGEPGTPYDQSSRADGPVVVTLAGAAPTVTIARSGAGYADRVRAMMPDEYEQFCFGGLRDDAIAAAVRSRFVADVSDEG
jgi:hypothetical protein